ncbi:MAG TPA: hypothetical protein VN213_01225 [Solirubrobacteraceae bacterium]|nr:hypothetical protein [Solirubrobacteraceae bacterium]
MSAILTDVAGPAGAGRESVTARGAAAPRAGALSTAALVAAAFSLSAGLVHFVYAPEHWWLWVPYGLFFLGAGLGQTALAVLLVARRVGAWIASLAIAGNLGIIVLYAISRTPYGAPVGPMRGHAELPRLADMGTTAGELVTVIALLAFLPRRAARWASTLLLLAGAALWWLRLTDRLVY